MATDKDIMLGAFERMDSLVTDSPIAYPGVNFEPPSEGIWLELSHFPNESENYGWQTGTANTFLGFVQVSVYTRPGSGIVGIMDEAEKVITHFPKGTNFGPVQVRKRPYMSPPVTEGKQIFIPVTIPYRGIV